MTALLAILVLAQTAPVAETSGLFEYRRPADWASELTPDGHRFLRAPGGGEVLRFLAPEPWAGAPEAYHDALHAVLRQQAAVLSGGKATPFGAFLRSECVLGEAGRPQLWMALYVGKAGDRFQGVFYAAPTAEGFAKHRAAADGLVRSIELPGARERTATFEFTMPKGWRREDAPAQGTTSILPANLPPGPVCGLMAFPPKETAASADEHHEQVWAMLTANATLLEKPQGSEKGAFRSTRVKLRNAAGQDAWLILYTTKRGTVAETLFFAASIQAQVTQYGPLADGVVAGITFPAPAAAPSAEPLAPGGRRPRPIPGADRDVKLVGLWINGETGFKLGFDYGGGMSTRLRSNLNILALWENGIAYRGIYNAPIFTDNGSLGVQEGLAAVDAAALAGQAKFEDTRFSRWTEKGGVVDIPENWHGALKLTRDGPGFTAQDGGKWGRLAPVDGVTLDGTYVGAATAAAPEMRLLFRKDGTFEMANLVHTLGGPTNNPAFPLQGRGAYEFRKWSLVLRFEGGYAQAIQFHTSGEGLADAKKIILSGSEFLKR